MPAVLCLESLLHSDSPREEYRRRLDGWRAAHERSERQFRQLGNARLATGISALVIAALALGAAWISAWWLLAPLAVFVALAIAQDRVDVRRQASARGAAYYERAGARLENRWIGAGNPGERFRDPKHIYADDLDLFGRGSLFELLSTARTAAGERTLAHWLLAPGNLREAPARQQGVAELRPRIELREELALIGDDIRGAVDAKALAEWGDRPRVHFFRGSRPVALALGSAALLTLLLFLAHVVDLRPFLAVILGELIFGLLVRDSVLQVIDAVSTPAAELRLLGLLLERLEREPFTSEALVALAQSWKVHGTAASVHIRRVERLVEHLDSARHHQFFRLVAAALVWIPQFAMAIEAWRAECGPHIGTWMSAVGEFEALCSLACYAYERPDAVFPELAGDGEPFFDAGELRHPLIPAQEAVANDVRLDGECRLWIVSGSNMSGKSTLLRAVGLNAVLAWAGAPVTCARLRISPLHIGASMRANDSLTDHRSRFYAEISRLREIVDLARAGLPTLFLLDELLSGTNSHDRRIGADALVRGLVERGAIGMLTTHDLALAGISDAIGPRARNVHFEDHLEGGEIRFDYRLRDGVVTRSNALELMRAVGLDV